MFNVLLRPSVNINALRFASGFLSGFSSGIDIDAAANVNTSNPWLNLIFKIPLDTLQTLYTFLPVISDSPAIQNFYWPDMNYQEISILPRQVHNHNSICYGKYTQRMGKFAKYWLHFFCLFQKSALVYTCDNCKSRCTFRQPNERFLFF